MKFNIGDRVKFCGDSNRRNDYLADLESDWADHSLTTSEYEHRSKCIHGEECVVGEAADEDGVVGVRIGIDEELVFFEEGDLEKV